MSKAILKESGVAKPERSQVETGPSTLPSSIIINIGSSESSSSLSKYRGWIIGLVALFLVLGIFFSTFLLSGKIEESNKTIVLVDQEAIGRDLDLDKKIVDLRLAVEDSLAAVNQRLVEAKETLNGRIWYLQNQITKNKEKILDLKTQPVASSDQPAKKTSKKKKRSSSDFDFSELENIGEEFETMFE